MRKWELALLQFGGEEYLSRVALQQRVTEAMARSRGGARRVLAEFRFSLSSAYAAIERLEAKGLIESREGTDEEVIRLRGGRPYREFRLNAAGLAEKRKVTERENDRKRRERR